MTELAWLRAERDALGVEINNLRADIHDAIRHLEAVAATTYVDGHDYEKAHAAARTFLQRYKDAA